jgi:hypothetical protein
MARQVIDIGTQGNDGTGDSIRESFRKVNDNFTQLFSIFGSGDRISFQDLDDTPDGFPNGLPRGEVNSDADKIIVSNEDADALVAKKLVGGEGILVNHEDQNEIVITTTGGKLSNDQTPALSGHLNATGIYTIGNIPDPSQELVNAFNSLHQQGVGTPITEDDLIMSRGYADRRYVQTGGQTGVGGRIRVRSEPTDTSEYFITLGDWDEDGYAVVTDHGFNTAVNGAAFIYTNSGSTPATGLIKGTTYFVRYFDSNRLGIYASRIQALDEINFSTTRINVNIDPTVPVSQRGDEELVDGSYDPSLFGRWISDETLPRRSVVRRQGDDMEGPLYLFDHPGSLTGVGTPFGDDDLQAATKLYVDNSSYASTTNLFVSTIGRDDQPNTPEDKQGRAYSYAYATVGKACERAEEIIKESLSEPGPYRQTITYDNNAYAAYINSVGTGTGVIRTLNIFTEGQGVDQSKNLENRDLREGSIIKGFRSGATGKVISYEGIVGVNDVYVVELLHDTKDITYFETGYVDGANRLEENIEFFKEEVILYLNSKPSTVNYNEDTYSKNIESVVEAVRKDILFGGNSNTIKVAKTYRRGAGFSFQKI